MKTKIFIFVLLVLVFALMACSAVTTVSPTVNPPAKTAVASTSPTAKPADWQANWDQLLKDARREGRLNYYWTGSGPPELKDALTKYWKDNFGVEIEYVTGPAGDVLAKILIERRAGIYNVDIASYGLQPYFQANLKDETDPLEPLLILPDAKDTSKFVGGKLPFMDEDTHNAGYIMSPTSLPVINTDAMKMGGIKSIREFADPKWKGRIVYLDSSVTGPGLYWYRMVLKYVFPTESEGRTYFKQMASGMDTLSRDYRIMTEWVARGKFDIALGMTMDQPLAFMKAGAPVGLLDTPEPRRVSTSWGAYNILTKQPHPAAAKLWANWIFSKEGLSLISKYSGLPTVRTDVPPPPDMNPLLVPRNNDYVADLPEAMEANKYLRMIKEDFYPLFSK